MPSTDKEDNKESTEAELRFDQEVLWCISQFEKLLSTGKLPDAKSKLVFDKRLIGNDVPMRLCRAKKIPEQPFNYFNRQTVNMFLIKT